MADGGEYNSPPVLIKRKKFFTAGEVIEKLKEKNHKIKEVCEELTEELCPYDLSDKEANETDEIFERLASVVEYLRVKVGRLSKEYKARKFRHCPEKLEEKEISCSQFSVLQSDTDSNVDSQELSLSFDPAEELKERPSAYKKKPLNTEMTARSRRRRVGEKVDTIKQWSEEEGVSVTKLLGYFLYLENYHQGDKNLASTGWRIFTGEAISLKPGATLEESLWLMELSSMSQAVYLEMRLSFHDRFIFPAGSS